MTRGGMMGKMTKTTRSGKRRWIGVTGTTEEWEGKWYYWDPVEYKWNWVDDRVSQGQAKVCKAPRMVACKD